MRRSTVFTLCFTFSVAAHSLSAQRVQSLTTGAKVRVQRAAPEWTIVPGTYVTRDSASFVIDEYYFPGARISIPMRDVISVDMVVRERSSGEAFRVGAGRGALVGLGASAVLVTLAAISEARNGSGDSFISGRALAAALSVVLTGATTLIGGAIGSAHRDVWKPVPFRP